MLVEKEKNSSYLIYNFISFRWQEKQNFFSGKIIEYELGLKYPENLGYWKNLLLFWTILNKASAYLNPLGNDIYTGKNSTTNIYLFIVNNSNTAKR